jgi:two-component system phosphate regulon sensor histidine kinase PhoR
VKTTRPSILILYGSLIFSIISFLLALLIDFVIIPFSNALLIIIPLISGIIAYFVFYFLLKKFINNRLSLIYRSIQVNNGLDSVKKSTIDEVIEKAESDVKSWKEDRTTEISKLKEQEQFRREFLGNLAHELKTPVFSIQGYISTLLDGALEDENINRSFLERANKATDRMVGILEDLDQIAKLEVEDLKPELRSFDITELTKEIFETLELNSKQKRIQLVLNKDYGPIHVLADRTKIGQVLTNLINNSIAYGKENGKTEINLMVFENLVTIEVSDNGIGIDPKHFPRLFERFYRVEKSRNRNEGGSGLGLAIVKNILDSHGQAINVRSTENVGSTFSFSLEKSKISGPVSSRGIPLK